MSTRLDHLVDECIRQLDGRIVLGLPLGLGKPNRFANALYARACGDPAIRLEIVTALSLNPPCPGSDLEARFLNPFLSRHFGDHYPRLDYADDLAAGRLPDNVQVTEFYFQSGAMLGKPQAQRHYVSSNYTHVVRDLLDRGINVIAQLVAQRDGDDGRELSLSSNPDLTLDLACEIRNRTDRDCLFVAHVHPELPFMEGEAIVTPDFFDHVLDEDPDQKLFAVPRSPVSTPDHAIGLYASSLVRDGGTLQIGIGSLSDALVNSLIHRQTDNDAYRAFFDAHADAAGPFRSIGGTDPMENGLYGASEMFLDGFMHLYEAGILKREVFDSLDRQNAVNRDGPSAAGDERGKGALMDAAFYLGSGPFYDWLRSLDGNERPRFRMGPVSRINQLYGGNETLEKAQRQGARFINTCMKVDLMGAATSDGLENHQVVSGVGGQYNFVAMAHAMEDGRSILMLRSTRESGGKRESNIVWQYPHTTIPRHLRDIVVTEYGIANLRGRTDEECARALICIADSEFQESLRARAVEAGKLAAAWRVPAWARRNTPESLAKDEPLRAATGGLPPFPFGSDFTDEERRLIPALQALKAVSRSRLHLLAALIRGGRRHETALTRMGLNRPGNLKERASARLLCWALDRSDHARH